MHRAAQTAIVRRRPSRPAAALVEAGLIRGRVLDYSSGLGFDAGHFEWAAFDPHHGPRAPRGKFDTVVCTYVLNVLAPREARAVVDDILALLRPGGRAYLAVRRDRPPGGYPRGQRHVVLPLPVALERAGAFCIYLLESPQEKG